MEQSFIAPCSCIVTLKAGIEAISAGTTSCIYSELQRHLSWECCLSTPSEWSGRSFNCRNGKTPFISRTGVLLSVATWALRRKHFGIQGLNLNPPETMIRNWLMRRVHHTSALRQTEHEGFRPERASFAQDLQLDPTPKRENPTAQHAWLRNTSASELMATICAA